MPGYAFTGDSAEGENICIDRQGVKLDAGTNWKRPVSFIVCYTQWHHRAGRERQYLLPGFGQMNHCENILAGVSGVVRTTIPGAVEPERD